MKKLLNYIFQDPSNKAVFGFLIFFFIIVLCIAMREEDGFYENKIGFYSIGFIFLFWLVANIIKYNQDKKDDTE